MKTVETCHRVGILTYPPGRVNKMLGCLSKVWELFQAIHPSSQQCERLRQRIQLASLQRMRSMNEAVCGFVRRQCFL